MGGMIVLASLTVAAPVPSRDDPVSPTALRMLGDEGVRSELKLYVKPGISPRKSLTAAQRARLRQLERQALGPAAFADVAVQKTLHLTESQQELIAELLTRQDQKIREYLAIFGNDDADNLKGGLLAHRESALAAIEAALTGDQRKLWKELAGEPAQSFDPALYWLYVIVEERLKKE